MPFLCIFWILGGSTGLLKKKLYLSEYLCELLMLAWLIFSELGSRQLPEPGDLECSCTSFFPWDFQLLHDFLYLCGWIICVLLSSFQTWIVISIEDLLLHMYMRYCCRKILHINISYGHPSNLHLHSLTIIASFFFQKMIWCFRLHHSALKVAIMFCRTCSCDLLCACVIADMTTLAMAHLLAR